MGSEKKTEATPPQQEYNASSISLEKDVALGLVGEHAQDIDPEVEARVVRKIDWFLIPAMIVGMHFHRTRTTNLSPRSKELMD
jgi:hypothetical protein